MKYAKQTDTGFNVGTLSQLFPDVSFPDRGPNAEWLAAQALFEVVEDIAVDPVAQRKIQIAPTLKNGKVYTCGIEQVTDAEKAVEVRALRSAQLAGSDWTQLADSTVNKAAWASYRQALRDIPKQTGFPWGVVWPTQPV